MQNIDYKNMKDHDALANLTCRSVLENIKNRSDGFRNSFISTDMTEGRTSKSFPSPDYVLKSKERKKSIWFEYKPYKTEKKRGLLTGLGQSIAYLSQNCSGSYLVIPNKIKDLDNVEYFFSELFQKNIKGNLPVGLIIYDYKNPKNVKIICDIPDGVTFNEFIPKRGDKEQYWSWWRDTSPDEIRLLLSINKGIDSSITGRERKALVWDNFHDIYLCPKKIRVPDLLESDIKGLNGKNMIWLEKTKRQFKNGTINDTQIRDKIFDACRKDKVDNYFQDLKKNKNITLQQLEFVDPATYRLTHLGEIFLQRLELCNKDHKKMMKEFSYLMTGWGKWYNLINDIKDSFSSGKIPSKNSEYREILQKKFDERGYYKWNRNRSSSNIRKFLQAETQLMKHFGFINERGFIPSVGYIFNDEIINEALENYYKFYYDALNLDSR